jgi:hypothetical protein
MAYMVTLTTVGYTGHVVLDLNSLKQPADAIKAVQAIAKGGVGGVGG